MELLLDIVLVLLLTLTLFHALRLERALGVLQRDRAALEELVENFNTSTRQAETGVERLRAAADGAGRQIARQVEASGGLKEDLLFLVERGERLADRLDTLVRTARPLAQDVARPLQGYAPAPPEPPPPASPSIAAPSLDPSPLDPSPLNPGGPHRATPTPPAAAQAAEPGEPPARLRSQAERDLLRALRTVR